MRFLALVCAGLLIVGCDRKTITLDADRWVCAKTDVAHYTRLQPVGKTVMALPASQTRCVVYVRTDRDDS